MSKTKNTIEQEEQSGGILEILEESFVPKDHTAEGEEGRFTQGEEIEDDFIETLKTKKGKKNKEVEEELQEELNEEEVTEEVEEEGEEEDEEDEVETEEFSDESEQITLLYDAVAEAAGWDLEDTENKPKTAEELVNYINQAIEENSTPEYSDERVAKLDQFLKDGGNFEDFYKLETEELDYNSLDITSEYNQRRVVSDFLEAKGFNSAQISRKIEKYENAGILEDEAEDALDAIKELKKKEKEELLKRQKEEKKAFEEEQKKFYTSIVSQIENLEDIRGVAIKKSDKKELLDYIFRVESDGMTKYQKDYAKSSKNLIESAYFTMKGDSLISSAKKTGETSATNRFRNSLTTTKVKGTTKKLPSSAARPLWETASLLK